jgi:hypothetical protein
MSSGGVQGWFVFGKLIAPPPPLLNTFRPDCSGELSWSRELRAPPEPMPV